jgi:hypothetical protein
MKKFLSISGIVIVVACIGLWNLEGCQQTRSHMTSSVIGLDRVVTLYANDGSVIKQYKGRFQVEVVGSTARFIADGRAVTISGTFLIEEKD